MSAESGKEALKQFFKYLIYLPRNKEEKFKVFIVEASKEGGLLGQLIENIHPNAEVYWMDMPEEYHEEYTGQADYLIFFDEVCARHNILSLMKQWFGVLKDSGVCIFDFGHINENVDYGHVENLFYSCEMALEKYDGNGLFLVKRSAVERRTKKLECHYPKIYVVCPAFNKSGGPEVIHQLVYLMNRMGGEAYVAYGNTERVKIWTNIEFYRYVRGHVLKISDIPDEEESVVIIPETAIDFIFMTEKIRGFLWWLSVDNLHTNVDYANEKELINAIDSRVEGHLAQSAYAADFLVKNGVNGSRIRHLADYLNDTYLHADFDKVHKENIVVYNPKKGSEFTKKLLDNASNIEFVPIQNMTTEQVRELLLRAKVYIDFGNHPGKDRIPREAAMSGCIIITGKRGSAAFYEDVAIPEQYKFEDNENEIAGILGKIKEALESYEDLINDFENYRGRIMDEKEEFAEDVKHIFFAEGS